MRLYETERCGQRCRRDVQVASCKKNADGQAAHRRFNGLFGGMRGGGGGPGTRRLFAGALLVGQLNFV